MKEGLTMINEWNLVSEILPDDGERVLVYGEYPVYGKGKSYRRGFTCGKYDGFCQEWRCDNLIGIQPIAWARLPERPEGV